MKVNQELCFSVFNLFRAVGEKKSNDAPWLKQNINRLIRMMDNCVGVQELVSDVDKLETLILISIKRNIKEQGKWFSI
jgi:hypothetical protein